VRTGTHLILPCPPGGTSARGERLVWYVAYGSNLSPVRLGCYLAGGRPPGARRPHPGSVDRRAPLASRAVTIPHQLYFAGHSSQWGGAPAFVDLDPAPPGRGTLGRAYLLRWRQLEDLLAQENGRPHRPIDLAADELDAGGRHTVGPGRYETVLGLGRIALPPGLDDRVGAPAVTFTSPWGIERAPLGSPAPAYLRLIADGLRDTHLVGGGELHRYLARAGGTER
jgi:hypothetical protein